MEKVLIATNNNDKLEEFREIFTKHNIKVLSLADVDLNIEIPETGTTFFENAFIKARTIYDLTKIPTLADDSGLVIRSLSNRPGVYSARYAGEDATSLDNMNRVLSEMKNVPENKREAAFICELVFIDGDGSYMHSVGQCVGAITHAMFGENGFGYDPIFYYPPMHKTFGQMTRDEKLVVSHRSEALKRLVLKMEEKNARKID